MNSFKKLVMILISSLLLYCCNAANEKKLQEKTTKKEYNTVFSIAKTNINKTDEEQKKDIDNLAQEEDDDDYDDDNDVKPVSEKTTVHKQKKQKFKSLIHGIKMIKRNIKKEIQITTTSYKDTLREYYKDVRNMLKKLKPWISEHSAQRRELANAFTTAYDFLDKKRQQHANNRTFDEYITDAINAGKNNNESGKYGTSYRGNTNINFIVDFFDMLAKYVSIFAKNDKSAEEIFVFLKTKLLSTDPNVNRLITKWQ